MTDIVQHILASLEFSVISKEAGVIKNPIDRAEWIIDQVIKRGLVQDVGDTNFVVSGLSKAIIDQLYLN